ncbi:MAG TPA: RecQ family ATP-dependent DNA helicase [Abditibacteriaceae bacterium]|jgi:ATP-dependent DNA helicase RecQ
MNSSIDELLLQHFGFSEFRDGQREVIETLLSDEPHGGRALAIFPTGAGKSLCYQLPALALDGVTVVVSPLIALMKDQIDFLRSRGIEAARLDSSLGLEETRAVNDALYRGTLKLLYVAPERFNNERFVANLGRAKIALFAVDEAHCISEWGHNFRPDYLKLAQTAKDLNAPRILALTATATPPVADSICRGFEIPRTASFNTGFYRPNLNLAITPVTAARREQLLLSRLQKRAAGTTIVYVTLQRTAEIVAQMLVENGLAARAYHAGLAPEVREEIQNWWMAGNQNIVVATIAFGMGIDKSDVRAVYHFNLPKSLESYSQEIGRAGRDGARSTVELLACPDDVPALENFAYGDTPTRQALLSLCQEILAAGDELAVDIYEQSNKHDIRQLVLKTCLAYLELRGTIRQGTPYYARYEVALSAAPREISAQLSPEEFSFLESVLAQGRKGTKWISLDADAVAQNLQAERPRILRALENLEERNLAEVRATQPRQRFAVLRRDESAEELADDLAARFEKREGNEIARVASLLDWLQSDSCLWNALVGYFGEDRETNCGHCSWCITQKAAALPPAPELEIPDETTDELFPLLEEHHAALVAPRQIARFLCGLSSPALTQNKLSKHKLFGALQTHRFADVLAWCEEIADDTE